MANGKSQPSALIKRMSQTNAVMARNIFNSSYQRGMSVDAAIIDDAPNVDAMIEAWKVFPK